MPKQPRVRQQLYTPPVPPRWKGAEFLRQIQQLNERCLNLMSLAASEAVSGKRPERYRELWARLTPAAIQMSARLPFVILDVRFTDEVWWRSLAGPLDRSSDEETGSTAEWSPEVAAPLLSETLIIAWHIAKSDRRVARLALGMVPAVTETMANLTPQQLTAIAKRHRGALRLRWADDPEFWPRLLGAASDNDLQALSAIQVHAQLLFSGELLSRYPA